MDFDECLQQGTAKAVRIDEPKISAVRQVAHKKFTSSQLLKGNTHVLARISLLYEVLRELLEARALEEGFKIYNHECYVPFLKEILNMSTEAHLFNQLRKTRNKINYYGFDVNENEGKEITKKLSELIAFFDKQD